MKNKRPEDIAIRTVNQYRRRDILAYLSVRYYVENIAARTDYWANNTAVDLVLTNDQNSYCKTYHFKELTEEGSFTHREIILPTANEAIAEAALLAECSKHPIFSENPSSVFSYQLATESDRYGVFQHYIIGLRARQNAIAEACEKNPNSFLRHTDIKKFYPSISLELVSKIWNEKCDQTNINDRFRMLGNKLITGYRQLNEDPVAGTVPVGPAFSHFIGNMVLKDLDIKFSSTLPASYFRYVDDITLIGDNHSISESLAAIKKEFSILGLSLHDDESPKNIEGPCTDWLNYKDDYHDSNRSISWKTLIGDLRKFLLLHPDLKEEVETAFLNEGFRIPIFDYIVTTKDRSFLEKLLAIASEFAFRLKNQNITLQSLLRQCRFLRKTYLSEIYSLIESLPLQYNFERKSKIPKIRYRAGRLIYLASHEELITLSQSLKPIQEMYFHMEVMRSISTKNIDTILSMGANCAQAVCQPIKAENKPVFTTLTSLSQIQEQSLTVFKLHSITVEGDYQADSDLYKFATIGCDQSLMLNENAFIRDISCLHGLNENVLHSEILSTMFDQDEELALDAIDQHQEYLSP
ncbi:RNA-directed DNA polymerase [Parapedobacter defluvii]|uniref:RNA-directed DNA polymerase n=1 Tax=Parapedobacter defluvii TaxID=2045106 RepID=UPI003342D77E